MTQASDVADRFDRISDVYDETREPLAEEALDKAALILRRDGCVRILEVGIGTGRIAKPLLRRGLDIVGVDLSRGMLAKARQKGIDGLVMGDANRLPFGDRAFDAVILAHVLHLLENPAETFERLARVARYEIVAFVRKRDGPVTAPSPFPADAEREALRETFRKAAEELGYALPSRPADWRERFKSEIGFLSSHPPSEVVTVQDVNVVTTLGERLTFFEKRAYGFPTGIPEDVFRKAMERVRGASTDLGKEIRYRRAEEMAIWRLSNR